MKSHIDWNEIVPRLPVGLQQTLYLEAVKMVSNGATSDDPAERKRAYSREWYHKNKHRYKKVYIGSGTARKWTPEKIEEVRAYYKEHGHTASLKQFGISSSMLAKWKINKASTAA